MVNCAGWWEDDWQPSRWDVGGRQGGSSIDWGDMEIGSRVSGEGTAAHTPDRKRC